LGIANRQMRTVGPSKFGANLEMDDGGLQRIEFTDHPFNRVMLTIMGELKSVLPGDDPEAALKSSAVMVRLHATMRAIRTAEITALLERDNNGHFGLPGYVIAACAEAPLVGEFADFAMPVLLDVMKQKEAAGAGNKLELHVPDGMIGSREGDEILN